MITPPSGLSTPLRADGINGTTPFDGAFVTINRTGDLARSILGRTEKRIPVTQVTAVKFKPTSYWDRRGFVQFSMAGDVEWRTRRGTYGPMRTVLRDENAVVFKPSQQAGFELLRAAVEAAISGQAVSRR